MDAISKTTRQYMSEFKLKAEDIYYSILVASGISKMEAYIAIFHPLQTNIQALANKYERSNTQINALINTIKSKELESYSESQAKKEDLNNYKNKDFIIKELIGTLKNVKGIDRQKVLMAIADLQKMKGEDKEEAKRVLFYLPLPICDKCPNKSNIRNG